MKINDGLNSTCVIINKREAETIECSNPSCKRPLLIVHHTPDESGKIRYNIRVDCPSCPRHSYDFEVKGDLAYVPANGVLITDTEEKNDNLVIFKTQKDR